MSKFLDKSYPASSRSLPILPQYHQSQTNSEKHRTSMHIQHSFDSTRISRDFSRNEQTRPNDVPRSIPNELEAIDKGEFDVPSKICSGKRPDENNTKIRCRHDPCTGCEVHLMF